MFLNSFSSQLKDTLSMGVNIKYRIVDILNIEEKIIVKYEFLKTGEYLTADLTDIIKKNKLQFFSSQDILVLSKRFDMSQELLNAKANNIYGTKSSFYYPLTIMFILCLLISNLAAIKICNFWGVNVPGGILIFPLLYIINDVLTEVYGFSASRKVVWIALLSNLIFSVFLYIVVLMPYPEYWYEQESFAKIFSLSPRIFFASTISYLFGEMTNATILSLLKLRFKGKFFALRAIISTFIGALLESIVFCFAGFFGKFDVYQISIMALSLTIIKVIYEMLVMPITMRVVGFLKFKEAKDVFEKPSFKELFPSFNK